MNKDTWFDFERMQIKNYFSVRELQGVLTIIVIRYCSNPSYGKKFDNDEKNAENKQFWQRLGWTKFRKPKIIAKIKYLYQEEYLRIYSAF